MFGQLREAGFDIMVRNHAEAVLRVDFPVQTAELIAALVEFSLSPAELIASGGGEAKSTQRLRRLLYDAGWIKHNFHIQTTVDGVPKGDGTSHEIDHVRRADAGTIALEIEWNNKDPFFDRDLENFQRLHGQSVISAGVIVTRGVSLQTALRPRIEAFLRGAGHTDDAALVELGMKERTARQRKSVAQAMQAGDDFAAAFTRFFVADKFGQATTHWAKLAERIARGVGNPCPLLLIGLPEGCLRETPYSAATPELYR